MTIHFVDFMDKLSTRSLRSQSDTVVLGKGHVAKE